MIGYVIRRILAAVPILALVMVVVFSLLTLSPGDPAELIAGDSATPQQVAEIRSSLHLDRPFLVRAAEWGGAMVHGDFGVSLFSGVKVSTLIGQRAEPTIVLSIVTITFSILLGIPLGIAAACLSGRWLDRVVMTGSVLGFSVPVFIVGYLLVYIFSARLHWLPAQGYTPLADGAWACLRSVLLPALALSGVYTALIARVSRGAMIDVLMEDYIRTARAKGAGAARILLVHALPNAAVPILTVIGFGIGALLGGVVVTETVFNIAGLGQLAADAILRRDYPIIQAETLLFATVYVLVNLLVDLSYGLFDPRVRAGKAGS